MRKKFPLFYFIIFSLLLAVMSLPRNAVEDMRGTTIAFLAPTWQQLLAVKSFFSSKSTSESNAEELQKLRLENTLLQNEIHELKEMMHREMRLIQQMGGDKEAPSLDKQSVTQMKKRHQQEMQSLLKLQLQSIPSRVIFRSPISWNSSLWVNVGTQTNDFLGMPAITKNSPVIVGKSIVGIIDYVGTKQSRVRLITDSDLTPSVRAIRGVSHQHLIIEKINAILQMFAQQQVSLPITQEQSDLVTRLEKAALQLAPKEKPLYLAKGEIHGESKPIWRTQRHTLKGIGFNYDFADGEGPARDLRNGKPITPSDDPAIPILKVGDLLVTTGMDGVFPPNLLVGEVVKVNMLKEGDYYYELDAIPTAGNLDDLSLVYIIPPLGYDNEDQPKF